MRNLIFIFLIFISFSCNHSNSSSDKTTEVNSSQEIKTDRLNSATNEQKWILKSNKIHEDLIHKGVYSFLKLDTFYIYDVNNKLLAKRSLPLPSNMPNYNRELDTSYFVEQSQEDKYLFSVLRQEGEVASVRFYLIDLTSSKVLVDQPSYYNYLGSSDNNKYHTFEFGSSACGRSFAIFNSENKLLKEGGYYSCMNDKNQLRWSGNRIYYYDDCKKGIVLPKSLPKLKEQEVYVQKYYWTCERDSITNEFAIAGVE